MRTYVRVHNDERLPPRNESSSASASGIYAYRKQPGFERIWRSVVPTSMDAGAGGKFSSVDAAARRTTDRPRQGNPAAPQGGEAEPGSARPDRRHPPDLDLPHRVRPRQPDLGQRAPDRDRPAGPAPRTRRPRRRPRGQIRNRPPVGWRWGTVEKLRPEVADRVAFLAQSRR